MNQMSATRLLERLSDPLASAAPLGQHPDLELLLLCQSFCILEEQVDALTAAIPNEEEKNAAIRPLENKQSDMLGRIYQIQATTIDGHVARARAAVAWAPDLLGEGEGATHMVILTALLRDLLGEEVQ